MQVPLDGAASGNLSRMNEDTAIDYQTLQSALAEVGSVDDPSEVHGTLCGVLCVDESAPADSLVEEEVVADMRSMLERLRKATMANLLDPSMNFEPLLPEDGQVPLGDRVDAMARWSSGFVYGVASRGELDYGNLSGEVQEVIRDITELSKVGWTDDDSDEEQGESDYAELTEYLRVGVQLVFLELHSGQSPEQTSPQLH